MKVYVKVKKSFKHKAKSLKKGDILKVSRDLANKLAVDGLVTSATREEFDKFLQKQKQKNK